MQQVPRYQLTSENEPDVIPRRIYCNHMENFSFVCIVKVLGHLRYTEYAEGLICVRPNYVILLLEVYDR